MKEDWQQRLIAEHKELNERGHKLHEFFHSEQFSRLSRIEKQLLCIQSYAMLAYITALEARINFYMLELPDDGK